MGFAGSLFQWPDLHCAVDRMLAGMPTAVVPVGMSCKTTAFAPILA